MASHSEPSSRPPVRTRTHPSAKAPQSGEQWARIPFFEDTYAISDQGRVKRVAADPPKLHGRLIVSRHTHRGRLTVTLQRFGRPIAVFVDALIEQVFRRDAPDMTAAPVHKEDIRRLVPALRWQDAAPSVRSPTTDLETDPIRRLREALDIILDLPEPAWFAEYMLARRVDPLNRLRRAAQFIARLGIELNALQQRRQEEDDDWRVGGRRD